MKKLILLLLLPAVLVSCSSRKGELGERIEKMKETAEFGTVEYTIKKSSRPMTCVCWPSEIGKSFSPAQHI